METYNKPSGMNPPVTSGTEVSSIRRDAKDLAGDFVSSGREKSAGEISKLASALHRASEDLGDTPAAPYVQKAAGALERLADSVKDTNFNEIVTATERFARREPMMFLGGAFAIGLIVSRFFKSSERSGGMP